MSRMVCRTITLTLSKTPVANRAAQDKIKLVDNEKIMSNGSPTQIKEQVAKSQALIKELSMNEKTFAPQQEPKNSLLPYAMGGSVLATGLGVVAVS